MQGDSVEHSIKQYIVTAAADGAIAAAQELSRAIGVGLDEVLAAVRNAGEREPAVGRSVVARPGVATATGSASSPTVFALADSGAAIDNLTVVRVGEIGEVTRQAVRGGASRLNANQRILAAILLIAAVYPVLPSEVQEWLNKGSGIAEAIAAVLTLIKG